MGNHTMLGRFENPRRGIQARKLTTNVPKILDLKSSSEQIFFKNCRWVPLSIENLRKYINEDPCETAQTGVRVILPSAKAENIY